MVHERDAGFVEGNKFSCDPGDAFGEGVGAGFYDGFPCVVIREHFLHGNHIESNLDEKGVDSGGKISFSFSVFVLSKSIE